MVQTDDSRGLTSQKIYDRTSFDYSFASRRLCFSLSLFLYKHFFSDQLSFLKHSLYLFRKNRLFFKYKPSTQQSVKNHRYAQALSVIFSFLPPALHRVLIFILHTRNEQHSFFISKLPFCFVFLLNLFFRCVIPFCNFPIAFSF